MLESINEMLQLMLLILFVSASGAQGWIAFLDIVSHFTKQLEPYRPHPSQDKYSRIAIIIGIFVLLMD